MRPAASCCVLLRPVPSDLFLTPFDGAVGNRQNRQNRQTVTVGIVLVSTVVTTVTVGLAAVSCRVLLRPVPSDLFLTPFDGARRCRRKPSKPSDCDRGHRIRIHSSNDCDRGPR